LTWLRATWIARIVPLDHALTFHRWLGHALLALGVAHAAAFSASYASGHASAPLARLWLHSWRGATGMLLLLVLGTMWGLALPFVRRSSRFELFYFSHLLYAAWFVLALLHAPEFAPWAALPLVAWAIELFRRTRQRGRRSTIRVAQALRSGVTRLELERPPEFTHRPGDYVFLRIPALAAHEWHPFTLSSAPEKTALTVHVRSLGNWTTALRRLAEQRHAQGEGDALAVQIDGPYGSPATHIFESRYAVLIGAGIGVTPFASVLESLVLRANVLRERVGGTAPALRGGAPALEKVHFFWLNRDQYSFEWFAALLADLEVADARDLLEIQVCMTGGHGGASATGLQVAREIMHEVGQRDIITGLKALTYMGHPDWNRALAEIAARHAPEPVDVYFCGPKGLGRRLQPICERLGMRFREEQF
jgi:predicted ferric reductase